MQLFEDLFAAVMTATDPTDNNRPLHIMFQLKPSKKVCNLLLIQTEFTLCKVAFIAFFSSSDNSDTFL